MLIQQHSWSCGPAAVANVMRCFGSYPSERAARRACGTVPPSRCWACRKDGNPKAVHRCSTDEFAIMLGLRTLGEPHGLTATEYATDNEANAWQWLHGSLIHGRPAILCVDDWTHWALAVGTAGDRVTLIDSIGTKTNQAENGVYVLPKRKLMWRWVRAARNETEPLYAIQVGQR